LSGVVANIDTDALEQNVAVVRGAAPNARISAVIKANAYGHGVEIIAPVLDQHRFIDGFSVATVDEGVELRQLGVKKEVWVLTGFSTSEELDESVRYSLAPVVHSEYQFEMLKNKGASLKYSIEIETGMGRLGLHPNEVNRICQNKSFRRQIRVLMSHFAHADQMDSEHVYEQLAKFQSVTTNLKLPGSIAASGGILGYPESHMDWVRPGIMLYGATPFTSSTIANYQLAPVMSLTSSVISIRRLSKGASVGYGGDWVCPTEMNVGVVRCGYGDGYPRQVSGKSYVMLKCRKVPIIGRISMDSMMIDLRGFPQIEIGEPVTLWGNGLTLESVAGQSGTIPNEILSRLPKRVIRKKESKPPTNR
jgi:alanine racemase